MNFKKIAIILACILLGTASLYFAIDYIVYTDEERVVDILVETKKGIEAEDIITATKYVSEDYLDYYGLSKKDLQKIGKEVFEKFEDFKVIFQKKNITIENGKGIINLDFRILITYNGQRTFLFGDLNRPAAVTLLFERRRDSDKGWLLTGIKDLKSRWPIPKRRLK